MSHDNGMRRVGTAAALLAMAASLGKGIAGALKLPPMPRGAPVQDSRSGERRKRARFSAHRLHAQALKFGRSWRSKYHGVPQGPRECARRVRQMAAGKLDYTATALCLMAIQARTAKRERARL